MSIVNHYGDADFSLEISDGAGSSDTEVFGLDIVTLSSRFSLTGAVLDIHSNC